MTTCTRPRKAQRPVRSSRTEAAPPEPDRRLWEADPAKAFEAGVRRFLAVSHNA